MKFKIMNHISDKIIDMVLSNNYNEAQTELIKFGLNNNIKGHLFRKYLLYSIIYNENPFTFHIERNDNIHDLALIYDDLKLYYNLFNMEEPRLQSLNLDLYIDISKNTLLNQRIDILYNSVINTSFENFWQQILQYYKNYGLSDLSVYKAFRISNNQMVPIKSNINTKFDDLIGYDEQKEELKNNTQKFINGLDANNVLLYGDSGTGKSTMIKAILNEYYNRGLRIIEVYKHQLDTLVNLIETLSVRPYYFIIYMDDLSFDENEIEYKYLKSIIEGRIEDKPKNILIYASSNRRHLIKETFKDNLGEEISRNEAQSEKLSLVYRFGLRIYFSSLNPLKFKEMIKEMAIRHNINMAEDKLLSLANKWQMTNGELTGRTASQFIKSLEE